MKTVARRVNTSPRMTEYGRVRLTKKGWKAVRAVLGASPRPKGDTQKAPAAHLVMVSGTIFSTVTEPDFLERENLEGQV